MRRLALLCLLAMLGACADEAPGGTVSIPKSTFLALSSKVESTSNLQTRISTLEKDLAAQRKELMAKNSMVTSAVSKEKEQIKKLWALQTQLEAKEDELKQAKALQATLRGELTTAKAATERVAEEVKVKAALLEDKDEVLASAREQSALEISTLKEQLADRQKKLDEALGRQRLLQSHEDNRGKETDALADQVATISHENFGLKEEKAALSKKVEAVKADMVSRTRELKSTKRKLSNLEAASKERIALLFQFRKDTKEKAALLSKQKSDLAEQVAKVDALQALTTKLQNQLSSEQKNRKDTEISLKWAKRDFEAQKSNLQKLNRTESVLVESLNKMTAAHHSCAASKEMLEAEVKKETAVMGKVTASLKKSKAEAQAAKAEVASLQKDLKVARATARSLGKDKEDLEDKLKVQKRMRADVARLTKTLVKVTGELGKQRARVSALTKELKEKQDVIGKHEEAEAKIADEKKDLNLRESIALNKMGGLSEKLGKAQEQVKTYKTFTEALKKSLASAKADLAKLQQESASSQSMLKRKGEDVAKLQARIDELKKKLDVQKVANEALRMRQIGCIHKSHAAGSATGNGLLEVQPDEEL